MTVGHVDRERGGGVRNVTAATAASKNDIVAGIRHDVFLVVIRLWEVICETQLWQLLMGGDGGSK